MSDEPGQPAPAEAEFNFEASLEELEALVKKMEAGDLGLEESLVVFERGARLVRQCQAALKTAEQRVRILTEDGELAEFDVDAT